MYLYSQRSPANLGFYQRNRRSPALLGSLGFRPNQAVQRKVYARRPLANLGLRGYRGLGQDDLNITEVPISTSLLPAFNPSLIPDVTEPTISTTLDTSSLPSLGPSPAQAWSDVMAAPQSTDYASPQAASQAVLASGGTAAQAAAAAAKVASQVAAAATSGSPKPPAASSFLTSSTAGVPNTLLLAGGGLVVLLGLMGGRR